MQTTANAPIEALLETIGDNLRQRAKQAHIDQKSLASQADLNRNTISSALSGNDIRLSTLIRLSRVIGFPDWLLPLIEQPTPSPIERLSKTKRRFIQAKIQQNRPSHRKLGRQKH